MDQRLRQLRRRWLESKDVKTHAALLNHLCRVGLLDERRILCAGFFGHKASAEVLPELIKKYKVIVGDKTLHTEELNGFIHAIFYWPRDIYLRAMLAATKLTAQHISAPQIKDDLKTINVRFEDYINNSNPFTLIALTNASRLRYNWWSSSMSYSYHNRQRKLIDASSSMYRKSFHTGNIVAMRQIGTEFKDNIFREAIGNEVIPYLLGEWK